MARIDSYLLKKINLPKPYWNPDELPNKRNISGNVTISKFIKDEDPKKLFLYLYSKDFIWNEKVLSKLVFTFLVKGQPVYCVNGSSIGDDLKSFGMDDYDNGYELLTRIPTLFIYGIGDEGTDGFNKNQNAFVSVIEKRFFSSRKTIICSRYSPEEFASSKKYPETSGMRIFSCGTSVDISNQLEKK